MEDSQRDSELMRVIGQCQQSRLTWGQTFQRVWSLAYTQSKTQEFFTARVEISRGVLVRLIPNHNYNLLLRTIDFTCGQRTKQITIPWDLVEEIELLDWNVLRILVRDEPNPGFETFVLFFQVPEIMRFLAAITSMEFLYTNVGHSFIKVRTSPECSRALAENREDQDGLYTMLRYQYLDSVPGGNTPGYVFYRGNRSAMPRIPEFGFAEIPPPPGERRMFDYPRPFHFRMAKVNQPPMCPPRSPDSPRGRLYFAQAIKENRYFPPVTGYDLQLNPDFGPQYPIPQSELFKQNFPSWRPNLD